MIPFLPPKREPVGHTLRHGCPLPSSVMDPSARTISEEELLENLAWVQALARKLVRDPGRAEDVAQEVWLNALERPPRGTTGATLRAWLARVVHTLARQSLRTETSRSRRELAAARDEAEPSACDVVARTAMQQRLVGAVMELDEPERTTVLLRYVDGLSSRAIAARRGETPEAVRKRLSRALGRLRGRFAREYGDEGRHWIHALAPLAFGGGGDATKVALGEILGGALVSKTSWTIGVAAAVVALGAVGWFFLGGAHPSSPGAGVEGQVVSGSEREAVLGAESEATAPQLVETEDEDPGRTEVSGEAARPGPIYQLLDPEERPVTRAALVLCRDGAALVSGETDAAGRFTTALEEEGKAKLFVWAAGWAPQVHEVTLEPVAQTVTLRAGAVVSGRIVVDGGQPAERIPLSLFTVVPFVDTEEELGATAEELGIGPRNPRIVRTRAEADGSFHFDGLAADWSGTFSLPLDYRLTDPAEWDFQPSTTRLDRPREQLRFDVEKLLALTGRVVDFHEGQLVPVAGVQVRSRIEHPTPASTKRGRGQQSVDSEGRFRIPLASPSVQGGFIQFETSDHRLLATT